MKGVASDAVRLDGALLRIVMVVKNVVPSPHVGAEPQSFNGGVEVVP